MRMDAVVGVQGLAAVAATALATVGALPQLRRLLTSRDVAGLSISSAALGLGTELAWVGYTAHEELSFARCVYHATVPSGVVLGTWVAIGMEAVLWGLYGWWSHDVAYLAFGVVGSAAAVAIAGRIVTTRPRPPPSGVDGGESRKFAEPAPRIGDALPRMS